MASYVDINVSENSASKKLKIDETCDKVEQSIHNKIENLSKFKIEKILNNNTNRKVVCLQGVFENNDGTGLVVFEKTAFDEKELLNKNDYFAQSLLKKVFHNDIYGDYKYYPKIELNSIKTTIIHPATAKHIEKYAVQNLYIVDETPEIYNTITLPYINGEQFDLQWVYNILEHKSESERIVFEDPDPTAGFVLLPDLKWDGKLDTLYLLAILQVHNIKSLRDLRGEHLALLRNIKIKGTQAIQDKYGLDGSQLRIYLHYQPSFYHLHIHFTYLRHDAPGILAERAHLLTNVINNLEIAPDYYKRATLPFVVRECDNLFKKFEQKGLLMKVADKSCS